MKTTTEIWMNMQSEYVDQLNKCGDLGINPLNPSGRNEVNCQILECLKFLHKHIFVNNVLSTLGPSPSNKKKRSPKKSASKNRKNLENRTPFSDILNKGNCLAIINSQFQSMPTSSRSKYFLKCSAALRNIKKI